MGDLTENFSASEFACPCCGQSKMNIRTIKRLQEIRTKYGKRIDIAEGGGYRCDMYDQTNSAHKSGEAVDPLYPREDHYRLLVLAIEAGFTGIGDRNRKVDGVYRWQQHWDDAPPINGKRPRPWKWTY